MPGIVASDSAAIRATPKSVIRARSAASRMMFPGLTSRWTMPRAWATARPLATSAAIRTAVLGAIGAAVANARREVVPVHELHDEERLAAVGAGAEIADDRRMVQDGGRVSLAPEPQREVRIGDDLGAQQLHGHRPPELRVPRPEDGGHAAPPDQLVEAVAAGEQVSGFGHARTVAGIAERRHERGPTYS